MEDEKRGNPAIFIIFGASGDLTWRKLVAALYNLYLRDGCPKNLISSA